MYATEDEEDKVDDKVLTIREVAEALRLSYWTVLRLIKRGELVSLKIGSRRVVLEEDLREFLRRRRESAVGAVCQLRPA